MATTTDEIEGFLQEEGVKFKKRDDGRIITGYKTEHYRDGDGDLLVSIIICLHEDGEYIKIFTPNAFKCKDSPNLPLVLQALLMTSWFTKLVQFEYDQDDGEIRAIVEFPLEDAKLTRRQLMRCISGLVRILDSHYSMISAAIERGVIELPERQQQARQMQEMLRATGGDQEKLMREFAEFLARRKQQGGLDLED